MYVNDTEGRAQLLYAPVMVRGIGIYVCINCECT